MPRDSLTSRKVKGLSAVDVYDLASSVRDEFEKVIKLVGNEPMIILAAKVVETLEHLDRLTQILYTERIELDDLRLAVEEMKSKEALNAAEKEKYVKEKDELEQSWKKEAKELSYHAEKLEEENLLLRIAVEDLRTDSQDNIRSRQELNQVSKEMHLLREKMYNQKDELHLMKKSLSQKESEIEALQSQLERFTTLNADYRSRNSISTKQIQQLLDDKAELEIQLRENSSRGSVQLRKKKERDDSVAVDSDKKAVGRESCYLDEWEKTLGGKISENGKIIIDADDPNRPRYTQKELMKVIQERNDLKMQLMEALEQLSIYRPHQPKLEDCEDPVQGPINREPEEKLHPEKCHRATGIGRLFHSVLKGSTKLSHS